jgi:hypothetical protein
MREQLLDPWCAVGSCDSGGMGIGAGTWVMPRSSVSGKWTPAPLLQGLWQSTPEHQIADQHAGFADSVLPVYEAGLVDLVADDHVVTDGVRLMPYPATHRIMSA